MTDIAQVQAGLLARMEHFQQFARQPLIQPAVAQAGIAQSFEQALRAVDTQQHKASALMSDVDSGKSDNLMGAMLEGQKASVAFSALMQVRNKLTSAFDDIMRTPL